MMRSLSVQRMQVSADPQDWVWVRWKWCKPGAKTVPYDHFSLFPIWDDPLNNPAVGPQILSQPQQFRGRAVSPFPGDHVKGTEEEFADGLPTNRAPGEAFLNGCQGELWFTSIDTDTEMHGDDAPTIVRLSGGGGGGGKMVINGPCPFFYGSCAHVAGGGGGGGAMAFTTGAGVRLVGGGAGGGSLVELPGGAETLAGGGAGGGSMEMEGSTPTPPSFVGASITLAPTSGDTISYPAGLADGDTLIFLAVWPAVNGSAVLPGGFTTLADGPSFGHTDQTYVATRTWSTGDPTSVSFSYTAVTPPNIAVLAVRNAGTVSAAAPIGNTGTTMEVSPFTIVSVGTLVFLVYSSLSGTDTGISTPAGYTLAVAGMEDQYPWVVYDEDVAAGGYGPIDQDASASDEWTACSITVAPL